MDIFQNGNHYHQIYHRGIPVNRLTIVEPVAPEKTGTMVTFKPDDEIFPVTEFEYERLRTRLREIAFLNKGLRIELKDSRPGKEQEDKFQFMIISARTKTAFCKTQLAKLSSVFNIPTLTPKTFTAIATMFAPRTAASMRTALSKRL